MKNYNFIGFGKLPAKYEKFNLKYYNYIVFKNKREIFVSLPDNYSGNIDIYLKYFFQTL